MTRERLQRLFLLWGRPFAPVAALLVSVVVEAKAPSARAQHLIALVVVLMVLALGYRLLALRLSPAFVLRVALALDTLVIAAMTIATHRPGAVAIAYFWAIALGAWLLGPVETIAYAFLASACAIVAPLLADQPQDAFVTTTVVLVLLLIGSLVALLSASALRTEAELQRGREIDASVAAILERTRTTLSPRELVQSIVAALGEECNASRAILRRVDGTFYLWERAGVPSFDVTATSPAMNAVVSRGEPIRVRRLDEADGELAAYMRHGGIARLIGYPLVWQGEVIGAIGVHDDRDGPWTGGVDSVISRVAPQFAAALVQAEAFEQLQEVSRMREELISNVSHELRTPLTSTIGFLQTLERHDLALSETERRDLISIARREAERLALLVQDLLQLATLDRGALRLDASSIRLTEIVREAARAIGTSTDRSIAIDVPGELVAHADPARILQVLRNLLENAVRHGAGEIAVSGETGGGALRILVTDQGTGVPAEHLDDLFVPFAHWSGRNDSSGLGLAIARRIAEAHGGRLDYRPAGDDLPHAFVLELPI